MLTKSKTYIIRFCFNNYFDVFICLIKNLRLIYNYSVSVTALQYTYVKLIKPISKRKSKSLALRDGMLQITGDQQNYLFVLKYLYVAIWSILRSNKNNASNYILLII